ncbi:flagellar biosynthesis protein FlhF [Clostridium septicum]|uniref:Flagellar biosynthesis protein FlhF n=1 Tax=Clostridium septicum TaxID=1504 RepID=A0A9N7JJG2_CLOSE|nr:flagellar biosynthesis protein FlhF [Clostridium septicum]AYE33415.1 flagellar biosynthesis protein FlhF [Clostridium septicum]MDU1313976.1 flagellar biosynthesis protein FlhF [Clostridium septicum]QAS61589.1 flagellar biosynthesis protein FlhF [Clostridium septicum]UEC21975.1 flagellar biosynthesis protein FlhF [Clostridium septicum]USR99993.1 flagellar biosynthesis protein FlhF [Clostridium septicum]
MIIKKYLAKNMNEALIKIRSELGKDAIIISQRKVRAAGVKGYFSPKIIEITAAIENSKTPAKSEGRKYTKSSNDFNESLEDFKKLIQKGQDGLKAKNIEQQVHKPENKQENKLEKSELDSEVKEIKNLLSKVIKNTEKEEDLILKKLKDIDIDEVFFEEIREQCSDDVKNFEEDFNKVLSKDIHIWDGDLNGKVVLVGPTGVGKTTTIAKLAGRLSLIDKKKVGLITIDTYRIGAVEQLKTYAEIMGIPFRVVITLKEMEQAIKDLEDCDVVLIDTTGRSSKNYMQISELRAYVNKVNADHTALVVSSTTKNRDLDVIIKGYSEIGYDKIIITKLDETRAYGSIYNICKKSNSKIAYITTGQNVPDDIKRPKIEELKKIVLGEENLC